MTNLCSKCNAEINPDSTSPESSNPTYAEYDSRARKAFAQGDRDGAEAILSEAEALGLEPKPEDLESFEVFAKKGRQPTYAQYRSRAMAAASAGDKDQAKAILVEAKSMGLAPSPEDRESFDVFSRKI